MNISIVIPVYNEEEHLGACLDAIARQTKAPLEVIVVDNNSTDATAAVAKGYDFVKVINESRQGVVHARTTGFDIALGEVIARIDADSVLPDNWTETVEAVFSDGTIDAASGVAHYYGVAAQNAINRIDLFFRRRLSRTMKDTMYLWGANMAIRKSAWEAARSKLCQKGDQHEDFDIAIHLQAIGGNVVFDERLHASVSSRRIDSDFISFMKYVWISPSTYQQHGIKVRRQLYPVVLFCALMYIPGYVLHRGYDEEAGKFSLSRFFGESPAARVDPTANVA